MTRARNSANLASHGNLFVDIANDRTGIGSVVPAQNLHVAGTAGFHADVTFTGDLYNTTWDRSDNSLKFVDNAKAQFGTGNDLTIRHTGSASYIENSTGFLFIHGNDIALRSQAQENYIICDANAEVQIFYDGSKKLETTAYGTNITGTTDTDGLIVSGVATVTTMNVTGVLTYDDVTSVDSVGVVTAREGVIIPDNKALSLGNRVVGSTAGDLRIYHDGSNSYIDEIGSGNLFIRNGTDTAIFCQTDGTVKLYNNGTERLATTHNSVNITGNLNVSQSIGFQSQLQCNGDVNFNGDNYNILFDKSDSTFEFADNAKLRIGDGNHFQIFHDGTDTRFTNSSTHNIIKITSSEDIELHKDTGIAENLFHIGDTNTKIRFPAADTFSVETGGNESFRIDSIGRLLHGTTSSLIQDYRYRAQIQRTGSNALDSGILGLYFTGTSGASAQNVATAIGFHKKESDGSALANNGGIGILRFNGFDGSNYVEAATIGVEVDGSAGTNDMPGRIEFSTTADGASSPTERLRITSGGNVNIGGDYTETNYALSVNGKFRVKRQEADIWLESTGANKIWRILGSTGGSTHMFRIYDQSNASDRLNIDSSGNVTISTGNLTIPNSIIHSGDTDTKIKFGTNEIDFQAAGASRFKVTQYATYVQSGHALAFLATGGGATPHIKSGGTNNQDLLFTAGTGNPTRLRVTSTGSVRVGDNSSFSAHANASNLVVGATSGSHGMTLLTGSGTGTIFFNDGSGNDGVVQYVHSSSPNYMRIASSGHIRFDAARMSISDDNIAPTAGDLASGASFGIPRLHMRGDNAQSGAYELMARFQSGTDADNSGATIVLNHSNDRGLALQGGRGASNRSFGAIKAVDNLGRLSSCIEYLGGNGQGVNNLRFFTGESTTTSERLRIDSAGRILIAKGDPDTTTSQIQIGNGTTGYSWDNGDIPQVLIAGVNNESPTSGTLNIALRVADENNNNMFQIHNRGGGNSDVGQVYVAGNLGLGTLNPSTALEVKGDITVYNSNNQGDIFFGEHGNVSDSKALIRMDQLSSTAGELQFHTESGGTLTKRLTITSAGKILFGNHLNDRGAQLQYEGSEHAGIGIHRNSGSHSSPALQFSKSRGTSAGSNTIVQHNDYLGLIRFSGTDGSDLASGAQITAIVDATPGNNDMPTRLGFWTSPDGSQTPQESMRITKDGFITKPRQAMFEARGNNIAFSAQSPLPYPSVAYNIGNCYDNSTYKFTAPTDGYYQVMAHVIPTDYTAGGNNVELYVMDNHGTRYFLDRDVKSTNFTSNNFSVGGVRIIYADTGDTLWLQFHSISGTPKVETASFFSIMLVA